jgi:C4-dicarboxylate-specific signal transduction histidine kinase
MQISDNGPGIPEDMMSKVTDPFCTTSANKKTDWDFHF